MVLTNWGELDFKADDGTETTASPEAGDAAMWLNIVAQWVMFALYIWTLVAPTLFPDRDFS